MDLIENIKSVHLWVADVEATMMSSPSSQVCFTGQEVDEIVERFQEILLEQLNSDQLEVMVRAIIVLVTATQGLTGKEDLLAGLLRGIFSSFLFLCQSHEVPLHTVIKVVLEPDKKVTVEEHRLPVDCVDTHRAKPLDCTLQRPLEQACLTVPHHL